MRAKKASEKAERDRLANEARARAAPDAKQREAAKATNIAAKAKAAGEAAGDSRLRTEAANDRRDEAAAAETTKSAGEVISPAGVAGDKATTSL